MSVFFQLSKHMYHMTQVKIVCVCVCACDAMMEQAWVAHPTNISDFS